MFFKNTEPNEGERDGFGRGSKFPGNDFNYTDPFEFETDKRSESAKRLDDLVDIIKGIAKLLLAATLLFGFIVTLLGLAKLFLIIALLIFHG